MNDKPLQGALAILDTFDQTNESSAIVVAKCRALMRGYHARWHNAGYNATAVEQTYTAPLYNPATQSQSKTFTMAGKIDVIAELHRRTFIIDHKTTSQEIDNPDAPYWRQLVVEGQVNHYYLLQWVNGLKPDGAVWSVTRKPTISPKKLSKAELAAAVSRRTYFGVPLSNTSLSELQIQDRETLEMYEARLTYDCTVERPGWYFQRRCVPRTNSEIHEYAAELWEHSQEILHTRRRTKETGRLPPRNSSACMSYGSPCSFLGVCSGHSDIQSDRWRQKEHVHAELGNIPDAENALTNSRIRCFQLCRRLEYYKYVLRLERNESDEKDSLFFGHVWHAAMEAWWSFFLETRDGNEYTADQRAFCAG